jgi:hypothetical protein
MNLHMKAKEQLDSLREGKRKPKPEVKQEVRA